MEELIKYIETNKDIIIPTQTHNLITIKYEKNGAGFYLGIYVKGPGPYRCSGKIHIKDYCKDETVETTIWRVVDSKKECGEGWGINQEELVELLKKEL